MLEIMIVNGRIYISFICYLSNPSIPFTLYFYWMLNAHFCSSHCTGRLTKVPFTTTTKTLRSSQEGTELFIYCQMQTRTGATQPPFQHAPETFTFIVVKQVQ